MAFGEGRETIREIPDVIAKDMCKVGTGEVCTFSSTQLGVHHCLKSSTTQKMFAEARAKAGLKEGERDYCSGQPSFVPRDIEVDF